MRLLSVDELKTAKGIHYSKPHLYRLMKAGKFPQPIRLGELSGRHRHDTPMAALAA